MVLSGVLRDISDRKERERALEETNRRLDLALDGTDTGVYEWNLDLRAGRDEATAELFGTTPTAFEGTASAFYEYIHPDAGSRSKRRSSGVEKDERVDAEFRTDVDGETRWLRTRGVIEERDAQAPRLVAIATDITARKERERTLRANNDSLQELTQLLPKRTQRGRDRRSSHRIGLDRLARRLAT